MLVRGAGLALISPSLTSMRVGEKRHFVHESEWRGHLATFLQKAGLPRDTPLLTPSDALPRGCKLLIALGQEAGNVLLEERWTAKEAWLRRGYVFDGSLPTLVTLHPAEIARGEWKDSALLVRDLAKAKEIARSGHLRRPKREVEIVGSQRDARRAAQELRRSRVLAADIEIFDEHTLACIGFSDRSDRAVVFPATFIAEASGLLTAPDVGLIWQNGVFDLTFLLMRCGLRAAKPAGDTMLQWHSMYPELAGAAVGTRSNASRRTAKSLGFLASLYTLDAYWKGDYETEEEFFRYNGKDCCITFDIWEQQQALVEAMGVREVYERSLRLVWPVVDMGVRGMKVDEALRQQRIAEIEQRIASADTRLNEVVAPLLNGRLDALGAAERGLFEHVDGVCECCRHASNKQSACWSCAGFEKAPSKKDLVRAGGDPTLKKAELEAQMLTTCRVCAGEPRREWREWNPRSPAQTKVLLYDLLKLPPRREGGTLTTNEKALKDLLGQVGA